jgi:hypothetical protein
MLFKDSAYNARLRVETVWLAAERLEGRCAAVLGGITEVNWEPLLVESGQNPYTIFQQAN